MLSDLLDALYLEGERRRSDPETAAYEQALRNPDQVCEEDDELRQAVAAEDGTLHERILAFERTRKSIDQGRRVTSVKPPTTTEIRR